MSVFRRAVELRAAWDSTALSITPWGSRASSTAGVSVSDRTALSIIDFYAGVRIIADTVSLTPLQGYTRDKLGLFVPLTDAPMPIANPFVDLSLQDGLSQIVVSLILRGNAYLVGFGSPAAPSAWRVVSPDQVHVSWDNDGFREYTINGRVWDRDMVWHVSAFMLPGELKGAGIVEYCRNSLGLGLALDQVAASFFKNGTLTTGIISTDVPLTQDEIKATAQQFRDNHSGVANANLPVVLGGGAKYTPISLTPEDSQFLQSREFQRSEIATLLGIPPHLLGIVDKTTSWGTGIEVQGRAFVDYTLRSYYSRIESLVTSWLPKGSFAKFDTDAITRPETKERYSNYNLAITNGFMNKDEVRMKEGLPPLPDGAGQEYYTSIQVQPPTVDTPSAPAAPLPVSYPSTDLSS